MKYIEENGNTLTISKTPESKEGAYWIVASVKSTDKKVSICPRQMSMQLFVKGGEIINRTMTIKEAPYIICISSHKYVGDVYEDASYVSINYKNYNATKKEEREKKDIVILDNIVKNDKGEDVRNILTPEKEREAIKGLLDANNIYTDRKALLDLFQVELTTIKNLTADDNGLETDKLYFKDFEDGVNKVFASRRSLSQTNYLKNKNR